MTSLEIDKDDAVLIIKKDMTMEIALPHQEEDEPAQDNAVTATLLMLIANDAEVMNIFYTKTFLPQEEDNEE